MKTAMQELIIAMNKHYSNPSRADVFDTSIYLEKEKEQIINAHAEGVNDRIEYQINGAMDCDSTRSGEEYYNETYS